MLFAQGSKFWPKTDCESDFFSNQKAKRKRSEGLKVFCEAKRCEFASLRNISQKSEKSENFFKLVFIIKFPSSITIKVYLFDFGVFKFFQM